MAWKSRTLTESELDFMKVLWETGEATPDEILKTLETQGRPLTGGTVRNILSVMTEKDYITRRKHGKTYLYRALLDEESALKNMARNLLKTAFNGSESLMVTALLKHNDVRFEELNEIELLISEQKRRGGK